jgi:hypothetical protein
MEAQFQPEPIEQTQVLPQPPAELISTVLRRLGEGVGKVVYASEHWVVKRERSPSEVVAIVLLWNLLRKVKHLLPKRMAAKLFSGPSRQIRFLRVLVQAGMLIIPKSIWFTTHIQQAWRLYHRRNVRGERLAEAHLAGTSLIPNRVIFPPSRVRVRGWPGWLTVSEATERVESTLDQRLRVCAAHGSFDELETWLDRFLNLRQLGWQHGLFSVDAHLKNFGICGDRVVLLDTGGLTNRWTEIEQRLAFEKTVSRPHIQLGLGPILSQRPDIAKRFNARWKSIVNAKVVRQRWSTALQDQSAKQGNSGR